MHQAFHTVLDLDERTVVGDVGDLAEQAGVFRVATGDVLPRILAHLLQAERYAHLLAIELQHLDADFVTDLDHFGRMLDALPRHVRDVQQAVDAAEVDERTVVGEVLDHTFDFLAFLQVVEQLVALFAVFLLNHRAARDHDVVAFLVQLDDLEFEVLAFQIRGITHRAHINQRTGKERTDLVEFDGETALDLAVDATDDDFLGLESLFELVPCVMALGLLTRQTGGTESVFDGIQRDLDLVAHRTFDVAIHVGELNLGDHAFGLEARIDDDVVILDRDDSADNNGARLEIGVVEALFKELGEAFRHVFDSRSARNGPSYR